MVGRKRHVIVDINGWLSMVNLSARTSPKVPVRRPVSAPSASGVPGFYRTGSTAQPRTAEAPFADGAHDLSKPMSKAALLDVVVETVWLVDREPGFTFLPRHLGGLLTTVTPENGSSVCRRMMSRQKVVRLDGPLASPDAWTRGQAQYRSSRHSRRHGQPAPTSHQLLNTISN
jgi:hypothetical protein